MTFIHRFVMWLLRPLFGELESNMVRMIQALRYDRDGQAARLRESTDLIRMSIASLPKYDAQFSELTERVKMLEVSLRSPARLTLGTLMIWDAVAYSAEKYEKDTQQHGRTDRNKEVLAWASAYMNENEWSLPDADMMTTILALYDDLRQRRTVGKYD